MKFKENCVSVAVVPYENCLLLKVFIVIQFVTLALSAKHYICGIFELLILY